MLLLGSAAQQRLAQGARAVDILPAALNVIPGYCAAAPRESQPIAVVVPKPTARLDMRVRFHAANSPSEPFSLDTLGMGANLPTYPFAASAMALRAQAPLSTDDGHRNGVTRLRLDALTLAPESQSLVDEYATRAAHALCAVGSHGRCTAVLRSVAFLPEGSSAELAPVGGSSSDDGLVARMVLRCAGAGSLDARSAWDAGCEGGEVAMAFDESDAQQLTPLPAAALYAFGPSVARATLPVRHGFMVEALFDVVRDPRQSSARAETAAASETRVPRPPGHPMVEAHSAGAVQSLLQPRLPYATHAVDGELVAVNVPPCPAASTMLEALRQLLGSVGPGHALGVALASSHYELDSVVGPTAVNVAARLQLQGHDARLLAAATQLRDASQGRLQLSVVPILGEVRLGASPSLASCVALLPEHMPAATSVQWYRSFLGNMATGVVPAGALGGIATPSSDARVLGGLALVLWRPLG